jgi:hypothetical protein
MNGWVHAVLGFAVFGYLMFSPRLGKGLVENLRALRRHYDEHGRLP